MRMILTNLAYKEFVEFYELDPETDTVESALEKIWLKHELGQPGGQDPCQNHIQVMYNPAGKWLQEP